MSAATHPPRKSTDVFLKDIFKGKVLFCTGGGSGICKGMTRALMLHGADAIIVGRNLERVSTSAKELSNETGRICIAASADVRKPNQLKDAVNQCIQQFGKIDFVICGAAGNFLAPISGLSENGFKTVIEIDTLGTYNTIKSTLPYVRKSHGSYIHVSATLHYRGTPYQAHVSAAKAAVDALSQAFAVEEGPHGVRSNVIAPGLISDTEGASRLHDLLYKPGEGPDYPKETPLQRVGHVSDIANVAIFLFSEAANFITGRIFVVDGGAEHLRRPQLPYPSSVLDPKSVESIIKAKM